MRTTSFFAMGSKITISAESSGHADEYAEAAETRIREARRWFLEWEQRFSRFRPDSELSRLNQLSGQRVALSPDMTALLRAALHAARQTGGLVQPALLSALESAGYDRSFEQVLTNQPNIQPGGQPKLPASGPDWLLIQLDAHARNLWVPAGLRLDLGGFAKGWSADHAARRLSRHGPVLVNAGGDIAVSGPRGGNLPWQVGIARPEDERTHLAVLPVLRGGAATSGRNYRRWEQAGRAQHHLIDPRTGLPAETDILAATVLAGTAFEAEVAAKAVLILGSQAGMRWLEARPRLAGILALENGAVLSSPSLREFVRS